MRYVYGIAFLGDEFIMVRNLRRGGWEMPGGKVEEGESDLQAMEREFLEEVGHHFIVASSTDVDGVSVFAGRMGAREGKGEMAWQGFRELPAELSFPLVEYRPLVAWARKEILSHGVRANGPAPA
ncbi:MAG: NUDIX domain-containing protein [Methanomassiliicoccus sp.]|nr:NUDIX domain-containing protein [Methanomassiliicoccus sp.]